MTGRPGYHPALAHLMRSALRFYLCHLCNYMKHVTCHISLFIDIHREYGCIFNTKPNRTAVLFGRCPFRNMSTAPVRGNISTKVSPREHVVKLEFFEVFAPLYLHSILMLFYDLTPAAAASPEDCGF